MGPLALLSVRLWVRLGGLLLPSNVVVVVVDGVINAACPRLFWHFKIVAKKQAKSIPGTRTRIRTGLVLLLLLLLLLLGWQVASFGHISGYPHRKGALSASARGKLWDNILG